MSRRAAILLQRGSVPADRQADICGPYCLEERLKIASIVPAYAPEQAARLVRDGLVDTIVVAFEGRGLAELVVEIADAGGQTIAVHPQPRVLNPPSRIGAPARWITQLVRRCHKTGMEARQIAALLDEDTTDITSVLLRLGFDTTHR